MFPQAPSGTDAIYGGGKAGVFRREWVEQSENSHTVNVFAPGDMAPGEKLPVLVRTIHSSRNLTKNWSNSRTTFRSEMLIARSTGLDLRRFSQQRIS